MLSHFEVNTTEVWLLKDCRCRVPWIVISAAQKQGRPHCGTDTQSLPRLFQSESKRKEEGENHQNQVENSAEAVLVSTQAGYDCGQLSFDRSSILHTRPVRSLFPVFGWRNKDERRSGSGQNCFDTQQEKHDTGLAKSSPKPLDLRISLLLTIDPAVGNL